MSRKVTGLLWKLERKRAFTDQFKIAQEYLGWQLDNADEWFDKHSHKQLRRYVDF